MDDMDVLWAKERLQKIFSKDSIRLNVTHASGDGGCPVRYCRLCGGGEDLRRFCETHRWEGGEERYDQLLHNCFGVRPQSPDGMICEQCARQLRNTQRFRALVHSAFPRPSTGSSNQSKLEVFTQNKIKSKTKLLRHDLNKNSTRNRIDLIHKKLRNDTKVSIFNTSMQVRRMNIACTVCKQKYSMLVPFDDCKKFVCSRCKKYGDPQVHCRRGNVRNIQTSGLKTHLELHGKTNLKGRSRLFSVQKIPSQSVKIHVNSKPKYQCSQCTKKYSVVKNLAQHVDNVHRTSYSTVCKVCEKDLNTKEMLERHMRMHTGQPIYQCDVCMRVFKGKRLFQTHYLSHGK